MLYPAQNGRMRLNGHWPQRPRTGLIATEGVGNLEHLRFGARARNKARLERVALWAWIASVAAMLAGIPGSTAGLDLWQSLGRQSIPRARHGVETSESAAGLIRFRRSVFESRPVPTMPTTMTQAPATADVATDAEEASTIAYSAPAGSITGIIYAAAAEFGLDGGYLLSVAACESGLNPYAQNPSGYYGLFQFDQSTWSSYGYGSIYDPVAQAWTAARLIASGQASRWPNCA